MSTPTNMFLLNLTTADLLIILVCMPSSLVEFHAKDVWLLGSFLCKLVPFLENAMSNTSILIILAISFERYQAICRPFEVLYTCSKKRSLKIILCLWISDHIHWGEVEVCRTPIIGVWRVAYVLGIVVVFFFIPGIILVVLYASLSHTLNGLNANRAAMCVTHVASTSSNISNGSQKKSYQFQVIVMLVVIIIMFFICLLPIKVMILVGIFTSVQRMKQLGLEAYLNLMSFARIMFYINSAVNPILYNIVSTKFRHAFASTFTCRFKSTEGSLSLNNGHLSHRGPYTPYYKRSMGSRTWYSEFELYHAKFDGSSRYLSRVWGKKTNSNEV
ncbi:hypothetical protein CAPTEDRAFT_110011 [Capitella teleta]|uniref:G-protein coupled receptors family 1 profile domain-containing protein n=1 Tax=Capitella teleta TaxID=283909 RepID=R7UEE1_CAPTE|nr:hypothetical protein CAPTEDRAFT_110011 [Capitella teleta]|eukprot:ELU04431.1 hypothetical protein CAPTEDRAFT_110011 [Capitella teleta]